MSRRNFSLSWRWWNTEFSPPLYSLKWSVSVKLIECLVFSLCPWWGSTPQWTSLEKLLPCQAARERAGGGGWDANSPYKGRRRRYYLPLSDSFLGPNTLCTLIVNLWAFETSKLDIPVILFIYVVQYRSFIMVLYIHWMERIEYLCNESVRLRLRNKPYSSIPKNSENIEAFKKTLK